MSISPKTAASVFGEIYRTDHWRGGSGEGSTSDATVPYRHVLQRLLASGQVRSVLDVGCGDWQLGSLVDWTGIDYTGIDVVESVIAANESRFGSDSVRFLAAAAGSGTSLPPADLLLVKDVMQHWPNAEVMEFLDRVLPSYSFALLTNDVRSTHWDGPVNSDIQLGQWRTLDLQQPPFGLHPRRVWTYDVPGGWTKEIVLVARSRVWAMSEFLPRSVRRIARSIEPGIDGSG